MPEHNPLRRFAPWIVFAFAVGATIFALRFEGRRWWCACGSAAIWSSDILGKHNSQHVLDPYSFTHILHGIGFLLILMWLFPKVKREWLFVISLVLECCWEVVENSNAVIERYRSETAAIGYVGDSILNSVGDVFCAAIGCLIVRFLGVRLAIVYFLLSEILVLFWIRDNLTLNILMLIYPFDAIKTWQLG